MESKGCTHETCKMHASFMDDLDMNDPLLVNDYDPRKLAFRKLRPTKLCCVTKAALRSITVFNLKSHEKQDLTNLKMRHNLKKKTLFSQSKL